MRRQEWWWSPLPIAACQTGGTSAVQPSSAPPGPCAWHGPGREKPQCPHTPACARASTRPSMSCRAGTSPNAFAPACGCASKCPTMPRTDTPTTQAGCSKRAQAGSSKRGLPGCQHRAQAPNFSCWRCCRCCLYVIKVSPHTPCPSVPWRPPCTHSFGEHAEHSAQVCRRPQV